MLGPFSPGDSLRLYRLQRRGIALDVQRSLMQPRTPLLEAWLAFLTQQAMGQPTFVLYDPHDGEAFIQVAYRPHQAAADIAYIAPALADHQRAGSAWSRLLDSACLVAAEQGIQRVFANLPASGGEADVFQQAGFALYAGEDIYRFARQLPLSPREPPAGLRAQRPEDWPALQKLCVAITPQRVRQAEGGIALTTSGEKGCQRYVVPARQGDDLVAALTICIGGLAHWLRVQVHPDARRLAEAGSEGSSDSASARGLGGDLVDWGLTTLANQPARTIYCSVRHYENGVREALQASGFEPHVRRSLTVKHTMAWVKSSALEPLPALKSGAEAVPPAYRIDSDSELVSHEGRLATETRGE